MQNYRINRLVLACLALLVVASYGILLVGQTALDWLIKEDGLIESVGTVGYFVAGLFFLGVWWQRRNRKSMVGLRAISRRAVCGFFHPL